MYAVIFVIVQGEFTITRRR